MRNIASLLVLALVCACSEPPPPAKTCTTHTDCADKQFCNSGVCVTDSEAPAVTITSPTANAVVTVASVVLEGSVSDNSGIDLAGLDYALDGGDYVPLPIDNTFSAEIPLPDVEQESCSISVRATDSAGNVGYASVAFALDRKAPKVVISSPVAAVLLNSATAKLEGTVSDPSGGAITGLEYTLDGATYEQLPAGSTFTAEVPLPEIDKTDVTLTVRATNAAGFVGSSSVTFAVDRVKPKLSVSAPAKTVYLFADLGTTISFPVSASDGGGIENLEWSLDDGTTWNASTDPEHPVATHIVSAEDDGTELRLQVRASDTAGNLGIASADPVLVDAVRPAIQVSSPTENQAFELGTSVSVSGTASDKKLIKSISATLNGSPVDLTRDGDSFSATLSPTEESEFELVITAQDEPGNESTITVPFAVDNKPVVTVSAPAEGAVFNLASPSKMTFSGSVADATPTTLTYWIDQDAPTIGDVPATGTFSFELTLATEDETHHTLAYFATDSHGQKSDTQTLNFINDRIGPVVTVTAPTEGQVFNLLSASPTKVTGTIKDKHLDSATLKLDSDAAKDLTVPPETFSFDLALSPTDDNVAHELVIEAFDAAGNKTTTPARKFVVDRVAPKVAFTAPAHNAACAATCGPLEAIASLDKPSIHFAGTASDGMDSNGALTLSLDLCSSTPSKPSGTKTWYYDWTAPLDNGKPCAATITATDAAGNPAKASRDVWVDKVAPTMTLPQSNERLVPRSSNLVSFSERMEVASVGAAATFTPSGPTLVASGTESKNFRAADGSLLPYTVYKLAMAAGAKDLVGNTVASGATAQFLTATVAPQANLAIHTPVSTPRMAIDGDGNPVIAYWDPTAAKFFVSAWDGKAWSTKDFRSAPNTSDLRAVYQVETTSVVLPDLTLDRTVRVMYGASTSYGPSVAITSSKTLDPISWQVTSVVAGSPMSPMGALYGSPSFRVDGQNIIASYTRNELFTVEKTFSLLDPTAPPTDTKTVFTIPNGKPPHGVRGVGLATTGSLTPETDALAIYTPTGYNLASIDASHGGITIAGAPKGGGPAAWLIWSYVVPVNKPPFGLMDTTLLGFACSTGPDSASPYWDKSAETLPTDFDLLRVSALDIATSPSVVAFALDLGTNSTVAFASRPNSCPSTSPAWDLSIDDAKEPTVAVGPDGKVWKAYVKASTGALVLAE